MGHLCDESFHIMSQGIHSCSCCNERRQFHGKQGICKNNLCQQLWRKKNFFLVCMVIGNNSTSSHFTSCSCCSGNGYEMRNIIRYVNIATDQVIIFEKIFPVMNP